MAIALSQTELDFLNDFITEPLSDYEVDIYLFGSRVNSTNQKYSDVDILISTQNLTKELKQKLSEIEEKLIDSNFPYKVDLVIESEVAESYLSNIISQRILLPRMIN